MSVDELRKAAETLRKMAESAHDGPWESFPDGLVWDTVHRPGDPVSASTELGDADYIATMHPGVGLALAGWLDIAAQDHEIKFSHASCDQHALRIARLINGGEA